MTFEQYKYFLDQVSTLANGVTAFAMAQNLGFTAAIFSAEEFRKQIVLASKKWLYIPIIGGISIYFIPMCLCLHIQIVLLNESGTRNFGWIEFLLMAGRIFGVIFSAIPLVISMAAVRKPGNAIAAG